MPKYKLSVTIESDDVGPEAVRVFLGNLQAALGPSAITVNDPATGRHLRDVCRPSEAAKATFFGPWRHRRQKALEALTQTNGNIHEAARLMGVTEQTMLDYKKRLGFEPKALSA